MTLDRENESVRLLGQPDVELRLIIDQQLLTLQQKRLIHHSGHVRQQASHLSLLHADALSCHQWKKSQT